MAKHGKIQYYKIKESHELSSVSNGFSESRSLLDWFNNNVVVKRNEMLTFPLQCD